MHPLFKKIFFKAKLHTKRSREQKDDTRTLTVDATFVFQKVGLGSVSFLKCIIIKGRSNIV